MESIRSQIQRVQAAWTASARTQGIPVSAVPELEAIAPAPGAAPFWNRPMRCAGPLACSGLFPVRGAGGSRIALLSSGESSLAARLQSLEKARRSIRIQALIFKNDEAGRTIAEIYAQKKELAGKEVLVSGKVVKYNSGILERNWAHLRDGSGKAKDGSDDITVLLKDESAMGQVITARGKVVLDKDLGGMYKFAVVLEDAVLVK